MASRLQFGAELRSRKAGVWQSARAAYVQTYTLLFGYRMRSRPRKSPWKKFVARQTIIGRRRQCIS